MADSRLLEAICAYLGAAAAPASLRERQLARAAGVSVRSLQRELARSGLTFPALRAQAVESRYVAISAATPGTPRKALAAEVGFASPQALAHWRSRWRDQGTIG